MSQATREAIGTRLLADSDLDALLARDPNDPNMPDNPAASGPALLWMHASFEPPVYDAVTYRIESETPDKRFRPLPVGGGGLPTVVDEVYAFYIWTQEPDPSRLEAIHDRLRANLENQRIPLADGSGVIFQSELIVWQADFYNTTLKAFYGCARYRLRCRLYPDN